MMVSRATIVLVVFFIERSLGHAVPQSPIVGIVGGHRVDITDVPFMASVHIGGSYCGGTIIQEQFVLTAAHCMVKEHRTSDYVRVGSTDRNEGGTKVSINKYIPHEQYKQYSHNKRRYDLGLVKLSSLLFYDNVIAPINLANSDIEIYSGMKAYITGWGRTSSDDRTHVLHQVSVTVTSLSTCNNRYDNNWNSDNNICAYNYGAGTCRGDSGGPLIDRGQQIGIVSAGGGVDNCGYAPNVYVRISAHLDWINHQLMYA